MVRVENYVQEFLNFGMNFVNIIFMVDIIFFFNSFESAGLSTPRV